jgi:hypothetical protein
MKRIFLATIFTLIALSAYGQTQTTASGISPCTLKLAQSPAVRGVKLGMKIEDVLTMFPGSAEKDQIKSVIENVDGYPSFGVTTVYVNPWEYSTRDRFAGIADFSFVVLDDRVVKYRVEYAQPPHGPSWRNVSDFVAKLVDSFQLPPTMNWDEDQNVPSQRRLKCDEFQLEASSVNQQGSLTVSTLDPASKKQQERRAAFDEKLRREFKP